MKCETISLIYVLIICGMSQRKLSVYSAELSTIPAILLKPMMYLNRMYVAPFLGRPDYVCEMTPDEKDKLCQLVFNQKDMVSQYHVRYDEKVDKKSFDFNCYLRAFNCWINNIFRLGLSQAMLLCPVVNSETGEQFKKYLLCTNYSPDRVIVFETQDDGRVVAVVGLCDLDLNELHVKDKSNTNVVTN